MRNKLHQLLAYFVQRPNQVISKSELLDAVWGHGDYRERSLAQSLTELRKILGDSTSAPKFIRTLPNQGYIWIAPLNEKQEQIELASRFSPLWLLTGFALLLLVSLLLWPQQKSFSFIEKEKLVVGILPFENQTELASYQWVEYGLSDMLATDLIQFDGIEVVNASEINFRDENTALTLLKKYELDVLIQAEFAISDKKHHLSYTLIAADQSQIKGNFIADDLAYSMPVFASQVHNTLRPESQVSLTSYDWQVNAMYEYAKGQQAMVDKGCHLAQHYFAAAFVIDPTHYWSQLQLVFCQLELKQTESANTSLVVLSDIEINAHFTSLKYLAKAQLAYQQDNIAEAESALISSRYKTILGKNAQWLALGEKTAQVLTSR